jgi:hypothetical protein
MTGLERDKLERRLEALRRGNPAMPDDVARRIRERISVEAHRGARGRRMPSSSHYGRTVGQIVILVVLVSSTSWIVAHSVMPYFRPTTGIPMTGVGGHDNCLTTPAGQHESLVKAAASASAKTGARPG